jgi:VWFA-related protein
MRSLRAPLCGTILLSLFAIERSTAHAQQAPQNTPTIRVTSRLIFLDVTVVDKKGRPVVKGLTKGDFTITEDKKPERIVSFEAPDTHVIDADATVDDRSEKAPLTIFVLDLLNSSFEDFGYIRFMVHKYLAAQPAQLTSPAEIMVLGNKSLEMVQGYTLSRADLLYALDHIPPAIPYKEMYGFIEEQFIQSIDALQEIALQNQGVPGRKNIIWVGHGGPGISSLQVRAGSLDELNEYVHYTTNTLVNSRASLFVIYPALNYQSPVGTRSMFAAGTELGDDDPFSGDINFGIFVNETGGKLFYSRNDVNTEIKESEDLGSEYYTLTYQPPEGNVNGKFRRIRVTLRNPDLRVVTKAGYFAMDKDAAVGRRPQALVNIAEAVKSTIPFEALKVTIEDIVRHPDAGTAEFTVVLNPQNLDWRTAGERMSTVDFLLAAASLNKNRDFLATRVQDLTVVADNQDPAQLANTGARRSITIQIPRRTQTVRVVIETSANGRAGAVELDRRTIDAAPQTPTPEPKLLPQPRTQPVPVTQLRH